MQHRVRAQLAEALGDDNKYYCSLAHRRPVEKPELLVRYFVHSGGAADFADRYAEAMGPLNRWYCSELHGEEISDPEILWNYYRAHCNDWLEVTGSEAVATL